MENFKEKWKLEEKYHKFIYCAQELYNSEVIHAGEPSSNQGERKNIVAFCSDFYLMKSWKINYLFNFHAVLIYRVINKYYNG